MKTSLNLLLVAAALPFGEAHPRNGKAQALAQILRRASPQAPDGYAPKAVDCPDTRPSLRDASSLSDEENSFLSTRRSKSKQAMQDLLNRIGIPSFDVDAYFSSASTNDIPNIGIAASGGGYRAMLNGGGGIAAFDERSPGSTGKGQLGGLLQASTYFAGLSGGSWLVSSLYLNNYTSVTDIMQGEGNLWALGNSILEGPDESGISILNTANYYAELVDQVTSKSDAGYDTSLTDLWGRALSFQFINADEGGPGYTWSSLADDSDIQNGDAPLPIVIADQRLPDEQLVPGNATIVEFTPWEMGSWDPSIYGFAPLKYVGSKFDNGKLPNNKPCINGFDSASFVYGTSSSLFNQIVLQSSSALSDLPGDLNNLIQDLLNSTIGADNDDIADWEPNPFFGWQPDTNPTASTGSLTLVDGGENLENIPFHPLIQPVRKVDVIFALDSSADVPQTSWPNGTSLVATYQRSLNTALENNTAFPVIPSINTIVNLGLNNRPTFFGCDASNATNADVAPWPAPIIVYIPNAPYSAFSNTSTFQLSYNNTQRNAILQNGWDVATMANGTAALPGNPGSDVTWERCVGCAIMSRAWQRSGAQVPDVCNQCFSTFCWNGQTDDSNPGVYEPAPKESVTKLGAASSGVRVSGVAVALAGVAAVAVSLL